MRSLAEAKAHPRELIDRVEKGDAFNITRRGRPVARLTGMVRPRERIDAALLQSLSLTMAARIQTAAELVRSMRDDDRF